MQLDGTLDQFPLRELIEMVVYSSVTGVLEVRVSDEVGQIFFRDGHPYHARAGVRGGFDAVLAMFEQHHAPFRFVADSTSDGETLWMDPWELIERGELQARLWAQVRPHIPNLTWVPSLCSTASAEHIHISEGAWPVLSSVDGQRSVAQIAEALNMMPLDTCVALVSLLEQGLVAIRQPRPGLLEPRRLAPDLQRDSAAPTGDFFERLMANINLPDPHDQDPTDQETQIRTRSERYVDDCK